MPTTCKETYFFQGNSSLVISATHLSFPATAGANTCPLPALSQDDNAQPTEGGSHTPPVIHMGSLARSNDWEVPQNNSNPPKMFGLDVLVLPLSPHQAEVSEQAAEVLLPAPNLHPAG